MKLGGKEKEDKISAQTRAGPVSVRADIQEKIEAVCGSEGR